MESVWFFNLAISVGIAVWLVFILLCLLALILKEAAEVQQNNIEKDRQR